MTGQCGGELRPFAANHIKQDPQAYEDLEIVLKVEPHRSLSINQLIQ